MTDYLQPDFFRFGHDSIKLVNFVLSRVKTSQSVLDLGAGSGVIGIEIANSLSPKQLTLLEVQKDYLPYLEENLKNQLKVKLQHEVVIASFGASPPLGKFDLIVCNPPYYLPGHGQRGKDMRRDIARTFHLDDWEQLFSLITDCLSLEGRAYLVIKNDRFILHHLQERLPQELLLQEFLEGDVVFLELSRLQKDGDK